MASGRKNKKQKRGRRRGGRLSKVLQLLFVIALLAAVTMGATVFFQAEEIEVSGNRRYSAEEIIAATGIRIGDNLFHMNKFAIQDRVKEEMPYIEDILIRRKLPSTITIAVREWDAVAQILPGTGWVAPEPEEGKEDKPVPVAAEDAWLISVGGKLLETATEDSAGIHIRGLTALDARAGIILGVPEEEQERLDTVLALLRELETRGMMDQVSEVDVGMYDLVMTYAGRYDVKLPIHSDLSYKLDSFLAAAAERESAQGPDTTGTFDLTQKHYTAVYSPRRLK